MDVGMLFSMPEEWENAYEESETSKTSHGACFEFGMWPFLQIRKQSNPNSTLEWTRTLVSLLLTVGSPRQSIRLSIGYWFIS